MLAIHHRLVPCALVLVGLAAPSTAAPQDLLSARLFEGQTLPTGDTLRRIERVTPNLGGAGYVALVEVDPGERLELWADFVDDGTSTPQRLHALPLAPYDDAFVWWIQSYRQRVTWEMRQTGPTGSQRAVFENGAVYVESGDPSPVPGLVWSGVPFARPTSGGGYLLAGSLYDPAQQLVRRAIVEEGTPQPRLMVGDPIPGTSLSIQSIAGWASSPNGRHLLAEVTDSAGDEVLMLDGVPLSLHGEVMVKRELPSAQALAIIGTPTHRLRSFHSVAVNDEGEWAAGLSFSTFGGDPEYWGAQDGRLLDGSDILGATTLTRAGAPLFGRGERVGTIAGDVLRAGAAVDLDGDGVPEPGWSVFSAGWQGEPDGRGRVYSVAGLTRPGGGTVQAVVALPGRLPFRTVCSGEPNSAGLSGSLLAVGDDTVAPNELRLVAHQLPIGVPGMFVTSRTVAAPSQPFGSVGSLCLGGAIGRYTGSIFTSDGRGIAELPLDLTSMPLPTGAVAAGAGETWAFQAWYRDTLAGTPTSNFTDAVAVRLR